MTRFLPTAIVVCGITFPVMLFAQHHHGGHGRSSLHHGSRWGHSDWSYVVPHYQHYGQYTPQQHHGTYYVQGQQYYYTPTVVAPTVVAASPGGAPRPVSSPAQLKFGGFQYREDLAGRLQAEANLLCLDLHYNYRHNPGFQEVYREAYAILQAAKEVHQHQGDREAISRHVTDIDAKFHHVQQELAAFSRQSNRQVGTGGITTKAQGLEAVLHHLAYDVGVEPHSAATEEAPPPVGGGEAPPPAPIEPDSIATPPLTRP